MMRGILAALAAVWLLPSGALAQNLHEGFYVEGRGGVNFVQEIDVHEDPAGFTSAGGDIDIDLDNGWLANGAIGYASQVGWRVELEGGYRKNELDDIELSGIGPTANTDLDGDASVISGMFNVYFDFDPSLYGVGNWPIIPFVGIGAGVVEVEFDDGTGSDEEDLAFAYQIMAGLSVPVGDNITLSASYAFLDSSELDYDGFELDYTSHSVMGGLRFTF